jgi:hypothetical protein
MEADHAVAHATFVGQVRYSQSRTGTCQKTSTQSLFDEIVDIFVKKQVLVFRD